jgi:hypothetical protein
MGSRIRGQGFILVLCFQGKGKYVSIDTGLLIDLSRDHYTTVTQDNRRCLPTFSPASGLPRTNGIELGKTNIINISLSAHSYPAFRHLQEVREKDRIRAAK